MTSQQRRVLAVVSLGFFVVQLDLFIVNIAFPAIQRDFAGASLADLSWVLNGYAIVYASLLVAAGRLADLVGRRRVFIAGLLLFTSASALCALAPIASSLVGARVLQAVGAALVTPASLGLLLPEFAAVDRARAIASWVAVGGVAAASGPTLGGLLTVASWRLVFLVNVPVGIAGAILATRVLRESRDETATGLPDLLGTTLLSAGIAALVLGLVQGPSWGWGGAREIGCFAVSALLLSMFVLRSTRHTRPVVELAMLRVRSFAFASLATTLYMTAFAASLLSSVLYLTTVWHHSALLAGLEITPGPVLVAGISPFAGRLAGRVGQRYLIAAGCMLFACGCAWWFWRLGPTTPYWHSFLPGWLLCGTGVGFALPSMMSAGAGSLPPTRFATGSAVLTMCRQLGAALGVAVFVATLGHPPAGSVTNAFGHTWVFMVAASLAAAAAGFAVGVVRPHNLTSGEPALARASAHAVEGPRRTDAPWQVVRTK